MRFTAEDIAFAFIFCRDILRKAYAFERFFWPLVSIDRKQALRTLHAMESFRRLRRKNLYRSEHQRVELAGVEDEEARHIMPATAANPAVQKPAAERVQPVMPSANGHAEANTHSAHPEDGGPDTRREGG